MCDTKRLTHPKLFISGPTGNDECGQQHSWISSFLRVFCRRLHKEWFANTDNILVKETSSPPLFLSGKGPQDVNPDWLTSNVPNTVRVLLVFGKDDQQLEILASVAERLNWNVSIAKNLETAVQIFQNRFHDLVIIDHRGSRGQEANETCRALRNTKSHPSSVILALVKKSFLMIADEEEISILRLLDVGFSRALMECSHDKILVNELLGIYANEIKPKAQLAAVHALYLAVDRCKEMVFVTNEQHNVQFANKVSEKLLSYKMEELAGKNITDVITCENFPLMDQQLQRGREFEGNMNCRRKTNDTVTVNCRIIPYCAFGRKPTHYIYIHDTSYLLDSLGLVSQHPRGSLQSMRRGSFDVKSLGSDMQRRGSMAKLNNLPLEAPITKVMTLLNNAMAESTNPEVSMQIDKAIETLKNTELYAPVMREDIRAVHDPVTSDLIGALISAPLYKDSRRSSNDSTCRLSTFKLFSHSSVRAQAKTLHAPQEIEDLLDSSLDWEFDIFKLEALSEMRPLVFLGLSIMNEFQIPAELNCDERTLQNWLTVIEANYRSENSYHNSCHAADVLQATAIFLKSNRLKLMLNSIDVTAALIAATAHDIDHPGRSSQFLCNSSNKLAILYNDLTVLESHHASLTFKLTLSDENVNIFQNLEREEYKMLRANIIDMILATEMTKHFEHLAKFVNVCSIRGDVQSESFTEIDIDAVLMQTENITLVKRIMIKCADVSNPTRPLKNCIEWSRRIAEEYFCQTDEEKNMKLPVVMPMFDRQTCSIPKSQIGFVDYIITDMIEAWSAFIDMPEMIVYMRQNYEKWKEFHEQGISTLQDVELLQQSPELQIFKLPASP